MNCVMTVERKGDKVIVIDCPIFNSECRYLCEWHRGIISADKILCGFFNIDVDGIPIISNVTTSANLEIEKGDT